MNSLARKIGRSLRGLQHRFRQGAQPVGVDGQSSPSKRNIWAERHLDPTYWQGLIHWGQVPIVDQYTNRRISGDPSVNYIAYSAQRYFEPLRRKGPIRMLSLCSGVGQLEISMAKQGLVDHIIGYEVDGECVAAANQQAISEGVADRVKFVQMDLNKGAFPDERFDIIFNEAALHHISDLEHLLAECQKVCSPHTVFINHDYVGPNHHQWTKKQLSYINKILSLLPPEFRRSLTNPGAIHERKSALSMSQMLKIDPTEGVRAEDTVRVMKQFFDVSDFKPFGGTILHMLLNDMAGNFIAPEHEPLVNMLVLLEESLIDEGALTSDFAYWIATPK